MKGPSGDAAAEGLSGRASNPPIRILLVEDNDVFRESLVFLLGQREDVEVVGAVTDGASALAACAELGAEVVVIDYRLPDVNGAEVAARIRGGCPGASVVFLSASAGEEERAAARGSGWALVRKDEGVEPLVEAVVKAAARGRP